VKVDTVHEATWRRLNRPHGRLSFERVLDGLEECARCYNRTLTKIARDLRVRGLGPDGVTLFDFKAGFEDPARGALTTLDWAVTVVDPTAASGQLAADLARMVRDMRDGSSRRRASAGERATAATRGSEQRGRRAMSTPVRVGIIICDRYRSCAGGKCFRALRAREGAFSAYAGCEVELVGFTSCGGCPGGNIEYAPEEMKKNGADVIHLATGFVVGYPPCPYIEHFQRFIPEKYGIPVVIGTHPIPEKYYQTHTACGTWESAVWPPLVEPTLADAATRLTYD
jgi:predicted metal-binding protein